eukprot:6292067-Ditylum_brightwellii.AAC.1
MVAPAVHHWEHIQIGRMAVWALVADIAALQEYCCSYAFDFHIADCSSWPASSSDQPAHSFAAGACGLVVVAVWALTLGASASVVRLAEWYPALQAD